jgi:hypothetical protein
VPVLWQGHIEVQIKTGATLSSGGFNEVSSRVKHLGGDVLKLVIREAFHPALGAWRG